MSGPVPEGSIADLKAAIAACTLCAEHLPLGPRPITRFSATARILIIGQAPGTRVHASGVPWDDDSGERLRDWLGIGSTAFYDEGQVALVPMGFCYPGKAPGKNGGGGDAPPRRECAPQWHESVLGHLPADRLTLLVGTYAQARYLPEAKALSLTERVRAFGTFGSRIALPHPAWRARLWMTKHPWFEAEVLPALRQNIAARLN